ncbi:MAG: PEGA domain-containing protein [Candidatus Uhrbacteria bacterium]
MPLWLRRTLYISFIVCFVLIAPLLALYSMGYRYHWTKHHFERTGIIVVDGKPVDASVFIDGVRRADRLPARIGGLGQNEYTVRVERDGFHTWERRLAVFSGSATFITDITLFRSADPILDVSGTIRYSATSSDGEWLAYIRTTDSFEELWIEQLTTRVDHTLILRAPLTTSPVIMAWSPRGAQLLIHTATDTIIIDPRTPHTPQSITAELPHRTAIAAWPLNSDNYVYAVHGTTIRTISVKPLRSATFSLAITPRQPWAFADHTLYYANTSRALLTMIDVARNLQQHITLPESSAITRFLDLRKNTLSAETITPRQVISIDLHSTEVALRNGFTYDHAPQSDATLWHTDNFELWIEDDTSNAPQLLTRRDAPIVDAVRLSKAPYVIFAATGAVTAIELDAPQPRREIQLSTFDLISDIVPYADDSALLIVGERFGDTGLWRLPLR